MIPVTSKSAGSFALPGMSTERTDAAARAALEGRRTGLAALLPFVGPAVVASIGYMDPGNFATNIQAGAAYGYRLLWVVLAANAIAMLFQAMSARLGIVTGRNLAELCRDHFRRPSCGGCGSHPRSPRWRPISPNSSAARSRSGCCATCRCSPG